MKFFALSLLLATADASIRSSTSRRLSFELIAGYSPRSQVTDHNAIDLDQAAMELSLSDGTAQSFQVAREIYEQGGFSKSFAQVILSQPLSRTVSKGTQITGLGQNGQVVLGKAIGDFLPGSEIIRIQYKTSDIQADYVGCQVGAVFERDLAKDTSSSMVGCFAAGGQLSIEGSPERYNYTYNVFEDNDNARTIQGFSTGAKDKMYDCATCPYSDYEKFVEYYGAFDYADQWVLAAFASKNTDFKRGNANFAQYGFTGRAEAIKKGTVYMNIMMYVIREFEDALDDCKAKCINCNDDPVHAWDEGVAFYTGSLEGQDGVNSGKLYHALADKRCQNFKTCGTQGSEVAGISKLNYDLLSEFGRGQQELLVGNCDAARSSKERIAELIFVPVVQGSLRYAYITDKEIATAGEKAEAEGAVFAAAVLPVVHACNAKDAEIIYDNLAVGSGKADFAAVKKAFERNYKCMGITCEDIGGLWDSTQNKYMPGASPCKASSKKETNGLAIGLGVSAGLIALVGVGAVLFMRQREVMGSPIFEPALQKTEGIA